MNKNDLLTKRKQLGLTQSQFAELVSEKMFGSYKRISQKAIERMENGRSPVAWYVVKFFNEKGA